MKPNEPGKAWCLFWIRLYQAAFSPFLGPHCRFVPSCSSYARAAVETFGVFKGLRKAAFRLLRCHPLHPGGYDPICK